MTAAIADLLMALDDWQTAIRQLKKQGIAWSVKEQQLAQAEQRVLACLEQETVAQAIETLMQQAIASPDATAAALRASLATDAEPLLTLELRTVQPLTVSRTDLEKVIAAFCAAPDSDPPITQLAELKQAFFRLSTALSRQYRASMRLSRQPKKRRRRDLSLATLQTAIGIALLAGNTRMDATVANSSYILGGNALMVALQNFVGHLEPEPETAAIADEEA